MPDLQSTVAIQRYLVIEDLHGVLGHFELEKRRSVRENALSVLDGWNFPDIDTNREGVMIFRPGADAKSVSNIYVYAVPADFPEYDSEEIELESLDDIFGGAKGFPRVAALDFIYPNANFPRLPRVSDGYIAPLTIPVSFSDRRDNRRKFDLTVWIDSGRNVVSEDGRRVLSEVREQISAFAPELEKSVVTAMAREFVEQIAGR